MKTMRIKVFGRLNTPELTIGPGQVAIVDQKLGKQLCKSVQAEETKELTKGEKDRAKRKAADPDEEEKPKDKPKAKAKDKPKDEPKEPEDGGEELRGTVFDEG
jgi:hypothetical protein